MNDVAPLIEVHASEVHASRTCLRKWHGVYVQSLRENDTANGAMARGTAIHAILEDYLNGKGPIDTTTEYGRIAASGLKYLPPVGSVHTELEFSYPGDGWIYAGTIDMIKPYYVGDHKTTSNFKYQKNQDTLIEDPQAILYGIRAQLDGKSDIECQWIYYRTAGSKRAQETRFIYPGSLLQENKQKLDGEVRAILARRHLRLLDLEPTPTACFKYGKPCHLRSQCTDLRPTIGSLMSYSKEALLADLKAKAMGIANPAGVQMPPPVQGVAPPAGLPSLPTLTGSAPAQAAPAASAPAAGLPSLPSLTPPAQAAPAAAGLPSLPTLPGMTQQTLPNTAPIQTTVAPAGAGGLPSLPSLGAKALPALDPAIMAAAAKEESKKNPPAKDLAAPVIKALTPAISSPAAETSAHESSGIGVLYVDCLPIGVEVTPFAAIAAMCHDAIKEHHKLDHYKMVDFGKGLGLWVSAVKMYASASFIKELYVDTSATDQRDALEALLPLATYVIRGVK